MADIVRSFDPKRLRGALSDLRLEGYKACSPKRSRNYIYEYLAMAALRGADSEHPSLSVFQAMSFGPQALLTVLDQCDPSLIDKPFILAVQEAGAVDAHDLSKSYFSTFVQYTPLQFCARFDLWREARLLLTHGANPSFFNAQVTPTGMAAYCGSARVFAELFAFGCDLRLYLIPEHAPESSNAAGSTLLHRIANRPIAYSAQLSCARIMARDEVSYPDLMIKTLCDQSVLDWADKANNEAFKAIILQAIAEREASALKPATKKTSFAKRSPSL
jgi:hypothetical protein